MSEITDLNVDDSNETETTSFAQDLAKTAILSVVSTAGTLVGMIGVAYAADAVRQFRTKRAEKKAAAELAVPHEA
jgi:Mg/Co/Ni transporter MgtE